MDGKGEAPARRCKICGEDFTPKTWNQIYCGGTCKGKAENLRRRRKKLSAPEKLPVTAEDLPDADMMAELSRRGYSVEVEQRREEKRHKVKTKRFEGDYIKLGVYSCPHFGSKYQQLTAFREFYKVCADREIPLICGCGDGVDGNGRVYKGQIYEMFLHGYDAQRDYTIENHPREEGIETVMIGGNHGFSFIKDGGADILEAVAKERDDITYLGMYGGWLDIGPLCIYLMHADGGGAYARSYKPQKIVENFTPENKPHIVFIGHWHFACYLPAYRNVETFAIPSFQAQTPYLKRKNLFPVIGGLIVEIMPDDRGIASVKAEWLHWHIPKEKDY